MSQQPDVENWDALITAADGDPLALARLADRMVDGELPKLPVDAATEKARALCYRVITEAPDDVEVRAIAKSLLSETVPQWHATIILDRARNEAYDAALQEAIKPGMRVLEVGAGTGILAMMAARAGAIEVIACESNPLIAERARAIVEANGYADRVKIIGKHSTELRIGEDLSEPADVFVSEIISDSLIGEGMLPVTEDVMPRLLKPGAAIIPYRGAVRVALANYGGASTLRMGTVDGFDLSLFNLLVAPSYALAIENPLLSLSSAAADLFTFAFSDGGPFPGRHAQLTLRAKERANGVVQWVRIRTDADSYYENIPRTGEGSSWHAEFYPFADGSIAEPGEDIVVNGSHGQTTLRIWAGKP
ncbi:MAG: 50S ribosomal protein L11 methyltransferase [Pseudolabrys sp.]|nr:50S ribosomal protein L11 methyltransferase [Pseudolabrys sp.]